MAKHDIPPARRRDPARIAPLVGSRVEALARGADLRPIAEVLTIARDEIVRRWLEAARAQPFHAARPDGAVADDVLRFFDALALFLARAARHEVHPSPPPPLDDPAVREAASAYARTRLQQGLVAADVLTELRLLRQEIGRAIRMHADRAGDLVAGELLVHDALDGASVLALSVLGLHAGAHRWAEARRALLAEAGHVLADSPEYESLLKHVARLTVPLLADWCTVEIFGPDGVLEPVAVAHADPASMPLVEALQRHTSSHPSRPSSVLQTGKAELIPDVTDTMLRETARDAEHLALLRSLELHSSLIVPLRAHGRVLGTISLAIGASDRRFELDDLRVAEELAIQVALAIDNARLDRAAQEALHVRDELLAVVAHDLKTPLTAIKGNADLLHRRALAGQQIPARVGERAAAISAAAARMASQIEELLDVTRMRAGEPLELIRHPTDLVVLAYRVAALVQSTTARNTIDVESACPALVGMWDTIWLERMLGSLLGNAVEYSPAGGDIIVAVERQVQAGRPWARLAVRDHGVGIPAADRERIFDRGHRSANAIGRFPGERIGLAGVKQVVELHSGAIEVESVEGQGSTFTVRLPLAEDSAAAAFSQL